ncbi:MAG: DNA polymerase III subunit delta [Clostridiales Family XIII bacterium]|jgi:DNA polymerase-3 subunit delta|nr:DNA polymerase III subunit delta [Clostridiales Family XIII bacterium]
MAYKNDKKTNKPLGFELIRDAMSSNTVDNFGVILLFGREQLLVKMYQDRIINRYVNPAVRDFDLEIIEEPSSADTILNALEMLPMMSPKRVVVVDHFKGFDAAKDTVASLTDYISKSMNPSTVLIFVQDEVKKTSALYKAIQKLGSAFEMESLPRPALQNWISGKLEETIRKYVADDSRQMDQSVINAIIERSGYLSDAGSDLYEIDNIIDIICAYAGQGKMPTVSDVEACTDTITEVIIWDLLDAVSIGNKERGLYMLETMLLQGESIFGLLALLIGQFEIMMGVKEMQALRYTDQQMLKALNQKSMFRVNKLAGYARKYDLKQLMDLVSMLYTVDKHIKTGVYPETLALTMCIASM